MTRRTINCKYNVDRKTGILVWTEIEGDYLQRRVKLVRTETPHRDLDVSMNYTSVQYQLVEDPEGFYIAINTHPLIPIQGAVSVLNEVVYNGAGIFAIAMQEHAAVYHRNLSSRTTELSFYHKGVQVFSEPVTKENKMPKYDRRDTGLHLTPPRCNQEVRNRINEILEVALLSA